VKNGPEIATPVRALVRNDRKTAARARLAWRAPKDTKKSKMGKSNISIYKTGDFACLFLFSEQKHQKKLTVRRGFFQLA